MKRIAWFLVVSLFSVAIITGCSRHQEEKVGKLEIKEEGITEEEIIPAPIVSEQQLVPPPSETQLPPPSKEKITAPLVSPQELAPMTVSEPAKIGEGIEWNKKIQTALKNAGFYNGSIDGKIGPMSKKAIEEFQKSKGLKADGKVGLRTWAELEKYLNQAAPVAGN